MISVILDEQKYFTGCYVIDGEIADGVSCENLPMSNEEVETDYQKLSCYKLNDDGTWELDEAKYSKLIQEAADSYFIQLKETMIQDSKKNLASYLESYSIKSACHGGVEADYSISSEKQQHLASMIMTAQMAQTAGIPYQPSWNAKGKPCTYDWTLEELTQLAFEIEAVVRPLVSRQQAMEMELDAASTMEELEAVDITFGGGADGTA